MAITILDATRLPPPPPADPEPWGAPTLAEQKAWAAADLQALRDAIPGHPALADCATPDCMVCAVRDCPHEEPLHYDKDGCPACPPSSPAPATRPTGARSEPPGASLR